MKVIKQGNAWQRRITCRGCGAELLIEEADVQYEVTPEDAAKHQYDKEVLGTFSVDCPECETTLVVKPKDIPKPMADRIKEKKK